MKIYGTDEQGLVEEPELVKPQNSPEQVDAQVDLSQQVEVPVVEDNPTFSEVTNASFHTYSAIAGIAYATKDQTERNKQQLDIEYDWQFDQDLEFKTAGFSADEKSYIRTQAVNKDHADYLIERVREQKGFKEVIEKGSTGQVIGATFLALALDPINYATGAASFMAAGKVIRAAKIQNKIGKFGVHVGATAIDSAIYDAPQYMNNTQVDGTEVIYGMVGSAAIHTTLKGIGVGAGKAIESASSKINNQFADNTVHRGMLGNDNGATALSELEGAIQVAKKNSATVSEIQARRAEIDKKLEGTEGMAENVPSRGDMEVIRKSEGAAKATLKSVKANAKQDERILTKELTDKYKAEGMKPRKAKLKAGKEARAIVKADIAKAEKAVKSFETEKSVLAQKKQMADDNVKLTEERIKLDKELIELQGLDTDWKALVKEKKAFQEYITNSSKVESNATAKVEDDSAGAARAEGSKVEGDLVAEGTGTRTKTVDEFATDNAKFDDDIVGRQTGFTKAMSALSKKFGLTFFDKLARMEKADGGLSNELVKWARIHIGVDPTGLGSTANSAGNRAFALDNEFSQKLIITANNYRREWITSKFGKLREYLPSHKEEFDNTLYAARNRRNLAWEKADGDMATYKKFLDEEAKTTDALIVRAMDDLDKAYDDILDAMKKAGVRGSEDLAYKKGYLPRMWDVEKFKANRHNIPTYKKLLAKNFEEMYDLDPKAAAKAGSQFFDHVVNSAHGFTQDLSSLMARASDDELRHIFRGAGEDKIISIINARKAAVSKAKASFMKKRTTLDMNMEIDGIRLDDLVVKDIDFINARYAKDAAGMTAMGEKGFASKADWEMFVDSAKREAANLGQNVREVEELLNDIHALIHNRPVHNAMLKGVRQLGEYVNLLTYGASGVPQVAEYGVALGQVGVKHFVSNFFNTQGRMFRNFGDVDNFFGVKGGKQTTLQQFERIVGAVGEDAIVFSPHLNRFGENQTANVDKMFGLGGKLDPALSGSNKVLWYGNLMNGIRKHQLLQTFSASIDNVVENAGKLTKQDRVRYNSYGFTDELLDKIADMKAKGGFEISTWGHVKRLNEDIVDADTIQEFYSGIRNWQAIMVQQARPTEEIALTMGNTGSILTKAMQYPLQAMQKQVIRNIAYGDMKSGAYFGATSVMAFVAYVLKQEQLALGMEEKDREKFLKDMWDTDKIVSGMMMYHSGTGVLPEFANLAGVMGIIPQEYTPQGVYYDREGYREPNTNMDFMDLSPSTQMMKRTVQAGKDGIAAITTGEPSDNALKNLTKLAPFNNSYIGRYLQNSSED